MKLSYNESDLIYKECLTMKRIKGLVTLSIATSVLLLGSTVYVATANFSGTLPANKEIQRSVQ